MINIHHTSHRISVLISSKLRHGTRGEGQGHILEQGYDILGQVHGILGQVRGILGQGRDIWGQGRGIWALE